MSPWRETVFRPARAYTWIACALFGLVLSSGCTKTTTDAPYESCDPGDLCDDGLDCSETTLPASTGFSGDFCTSGCASDSDCIPDVSGFAAACVNDQCYLTCPSDDTCPYSQSCLTFDSNAGPISLCTP
jgi:hypothetical protein